LCVLCLLTALPFPAEARVFLRWGSGARVERTLETLGGKTIYEARITLNGGDGNLRICAFERPMHEVGRDLEKAFGTDGLTGRAASMAFATTRLRGRVLRFVVLDLTGGRQTLVFVIEQTKREFTRSKSPPADGAVDGIPEYPGCSPVFKAEDHNTGTAFAVSQARAPAATIREFYRVRLAADGWKEAISQADAGRPARISQPAGPSLIVCLKPGKLCCILAEENDFPGATRITIVHKTQRIE
jgi:hypothetical protein